jgi:Domain of unknown function (DUF4112)
MARVTRLPSVPRDQSSALSEVDLLAWLMDNSIPIPGTGGRRIGMDAVIGLVPFIGDVVGGAIGLFIVWRGSRLGLPRIAVMRMLVNSVIDIAIGAIPFLGDAFDLWFKANTRNLGVMRRHLEEPDRSTRDDWLGLLAVVGAAALVLFLIGWLVVSFLNALFGAL